MKSLWAIADMWQRTARTLRDAGLTAQAATARKLWRAAWDKAAHVESTREAVGLAPSAASEGRIL